MSAGDLTSPTRTSNGRSVLFVTSNFPRWAGDSTTPFVLHLAQDLQELGWRVDVLAPHASGAATAEELDGVHVRRFRYLWPTSQQTVCYGGGALVNLRKQRSNAIKLPILVAAEWASISRHLASRRYSVVHAHWILPQGFVTGLAPTWGAARLLTVHGGDIFGLQSNAMAPFKRFAVRRADAVTVNSSATEAAIKALWPSVEPVNIPMGVTERQPHATKVEQLRRKYRHGNGPLITFVGRLVDEKGVDDLLDALALLRSRLPDVSAVILGEGQDRAVFERRVGELDLSGCVTFSGWVPSEDVPDYLAASDVFVAPSRRAKDGWVEAQGLTIGEAMMVGTPVIATRIGGIVDVVIDGETGALVEERRPDQIADAIERFARDPAAARQVAERGQAMAREHFGRRQSAGRFSSLFEELVASRTVGP